MLLNIEMIKIQKKLREYKVDYIPKIMVKGEYKVDYIPKFYWAYALPKFAPL